MEFYGNILNIIGQKDTKGIIEFFEIFSSQ